MSLRHFESVIPLLVALSMLGGIAYAVNYGTSPFVILETVKRFPVQPITLNGVEYSIDASGAVHAVQSGNRVLDEATQEQVRRIAWYATITRVDPLFAFPGTNLEETADAIERIESFRSELAGIYPKHETKITESLFPTRFLEELLVLETARRELLAKPSPERVNTYAAALEQTIRVYQSELRKNRITFQQLDWEYPDTSYRLPTGTTTASTFAMSLATLETEATKRRSEANKRFACYSGMLNECVLPAFPERAVPNPSSANVDTPVLPLIADFVEKLPEGVAPNPVGSVVVLAESSCFTGATAYYPWWYERLDAFVIEYLHDAYFYKTEGHPAEYVRTVGATGLPFLFQSIATPYMCPDIDNDLLEVRTLYELRTTLSRNPIFANSSFTLLSGLEHALSNEAQLNEATAARYIAESARLLNRSERALMAELGEEKVATLGTFVVAAQTKTTGYAEALNTVVKANEIVRTFYDLGTPIDILSIFVSRGLPSLFFMAANESIAETRPLFSQKGPLKTKRYLLHSYQDDLRKERSLEEAVELMLEAYSIETRLNAR